MTFLYPLGFLALLGIPVLILIYIIKNRYTEQTIASTYLWTLSERFLRRRIPINRLTGILSLILQILAVILIALVVAHPVFTLPGAAEAYCFVLDGSGSMNIVQDGSTRFDAGREKIKDIIGSSVKGSTYTLIYAGNTTETIFEGYNDKELAIEAVDELERGFKAVGLGDALVEAQKYFNENPHALTYLVTDKIYSESSNVNIINVNGGTENYAISDVDYAFKADGYLEINGNAATYGSAATVTIELCFNGEDEAYAEKTADLVPEKKQAFDFRIEMNDFSSFELRIRDADDLPLDNSVTIYNVKHENMSRTLLVSDGPIYLRAALSAAGATQLDVMTPEEYAAYDGNIGYGLYIFENTVPDKTPRDAAVWFVNPDKSPDGANFSFQTDVDARDAAKYSTSTKTSVQKVLSGVKEKDFLIKKYVKLGTGGGDFTIYATCDGSPLIFSGANAYGNREVVLAFSMRDSASFTLSMDCVTLISNLMTYSFPEVVDATSYVCGDILQVNMIAGCSSIKIVSPFGKESYPDTNTTVSEYELTEVGAYKIYLTMSDGTEREINVFAALPEEERAPVAEEGAFLISGTPESGGLPGVYDDLMIIFIILAVVVAADYGVYCYEQYQLR